MRLWPYACAAYARPGVAELCLDAQDRHGRDVPLLLWGGWLGEIHAHRLTAEEAAAAVAALGPWSAGVVTPLREVRRRLKAGPFPAPTPGTEALRARIKRAELAAERLALSALEKLPARRRPGADHAHALSANLALLCPDTGPALAARLLAIAR